METLHVANIKCDGCAKTITSELEKLGATEVAVDIASGEVSFLGEKKAASERLASLGYPEVGTPKTESIFKKAKSFMSATARKMK